MPSPVSPLDRTLPPPAPTTATPAILVVDDEPLVIEMIGRMLAGSGMAITHAARSATDAWEWAAHHDVGLAMIDVALPEGRLAGIELAERLRRTTPAPVILMSSYSDDEAVGRAGPSGATSYLVKPFSDAQLHAAIVFALRRAEDPCADAARMPLFSRALRAIDQRLEEMTARLAEAGICPPAGIDARAEERLRANQQLSRRERDVVRLLLSNRRVSQIATELGISENTVRSHLKAAFRTLGVGSQVELIARFTSRPGCPAA